MILEMLGFDNSRLQKHPIGKGLVMEIYMKHHGS